MHNINQDQFIKLSDTGEYIILDVRTPEECAQGIVAGAYQINFLDQPTFALEIEKLDKEKKYLIYCRSGNRSGQACTMMDAIGFDSTSNLVGGMLEWTGPLEGQKVG